ncbi:RNA polymerase sigma factor [Labilibacter sediminis]|nr:RNA polymerase sigma factor [Labilibacter sediminis]
MSQIEEQNVVNQILNGNIHAFELIVNDFKERVINICFSYTNDLTDAEDISQEVFIEVYKSLHQFKKQASLATWIYRIASNKSIDHIRKRKRLKRGSELTGYLEDQKNIDWVTQNQSTPMDEVIQIQRKELLYYGLSKLPKRQKEAFVLTQIEGFDQKSAAEILETSVKSIESLVIRGKKKLKSVLEKQIKYYL